jgi:hypothetical protein
MRFQTDTAIPLTFYTNSTERMRIDSSGNIGINVTPSSTGSSVRAIEFGYGAISSYGSSEFDISGNAYISGSGWLFKTTAAASLYQQTAGNHSFQTVGSGTAGTSASFVEVAKITNAGVFSFNSGYGSSAPAYGCRAWVSFNATASPPTLRGNGNVSSVTKSATGDFIVNFTSAMPDANYAFTGGATKNDGNNDGNMFIQIGGTTTLAPNTSAVCCRTFYNGFTYQNSTYTTIAVFR